MSKTKITTPVEGYTGPGVGGLVFQDGVAETDNEAIINYAASAGYGIGSKAPVAPEQPEVPDPRDIDVEVVGTALRDAAVDPRPEDFLPPTNAGEANPHGPLVVAPGIHAIETQVIRPGVVHVDDLPAQEAAETEQAVKLLVERQDVGEALPTFVMDESDTGPLGLSDPGSVEQGVEAAEEIAANEPTPVEELKGAALAQALEDADLPKSGTADEKRARLAEYRAQ